MRVRNSSFSWQRLLGRSLLLVGLLTVASAYLAAQSRNVELTGVVEDASGAAVPGATVSVTNEATGVKIDTKTNEAGLYRVTNLIPGPYRVEVTVPGFKAFRREGFALQQAEIGRLDARMEVGQVTEQVTVTGEAPLLRTESSEALSQTVSRRDLQDLPNPLRKWDALVSLSALTTGNSPAGWSHGSVAIAGNDITVTGFYMNGAQANDMSGNMPVFGFTSEFTQEFRLIANSYSAEFTGPNVVSATTKSGTNTFHGGANYFIQDDALNANPWGASTKLPARETEWGFSVGGPIKKDKTHFFGGFQRVRFTASSPAFLTIPTQRQIAGDFSQTFDASGVLIPIYDPNTTSCVAGVCTRTQFPGNIIPANRIDPVGAKILSFYPSPNQAGTITGASNYFASRGLIQTTPQYNVRIDHQWNERHRTFGSYVNLHFNEDDPSIYGVPGVSDAAITIIGTRANILNLAHTYAPSPRWVLDTSWMTTTFRGVFGDAEAPSGQQGYPQQLGLQGVDPNARWFPTVSIAGYSVIGGGYVNAVNFEGFDNHSFAQRFGHQRGRHSLKFGAEVARMSIDVVIRFVSTSLTFDPLPTALPGVAGTGNAVAALLLGRTAAGARDDGAFQKRAPFLYAGYFEDSWKARDNLTLNLGLRFETLTPVIFRGRFDQPIKASFNPLPTNPVSGTPGIMTTPGVDGPAAVYKQSYNWMPRLGFAWQPWGAGSKTVVRGGAGIFYLNISGTGHYEGSTNGAGQERILGAFSSPDAGITPAFFLSDGLPPIPAGEKIGPGFGAVPVGDPPRFNIDYVDVNAYRRGYSLQYNFGIEHSLPGNMVLTAQYLANLGRHLAGTEANNQIHPSQFGPGNAQIRRPFPQYGYVNNTEARVFNSSFHALELKMVKRLSGGLSFQSDYLFNKYLSDYQPWNRYDRTTAKAMQDAQHRLVTYAVYDLPWGPGRRWLTAGPLSKVAGSWTVTPVLRLQSGPYADITYIADTTNGFIQGNQGVNLVGNPNLSGGQRTLARWFNTDAFAAPAPFTLGNAGRSIVQMPGLIGFDMGIRRETRITERVSIEFGVDLLNAFNHPNAGFPGTTLGAPDFGLISSKGVNTGRWGGVNLTNRRIQLGARLTF